MVLMIVERYRFNMLIPKKEVIRDEKYRRWVASLPCIITGTDQVQAAHIRYMSGAGMGSKPSDDRCIPLCWMQHKLQHNTSELKFWYPYGGVEKAISYANRLYNVRFDTASAQSLLMEFRHGNRFLHNIRGVEG